MTTNKINNSFKDFQTNSKNLFFDSVFTILIFCVMFLIISSPLTYTSGTIEGLKLFVFSVLPGLFPFMFLTKLLTEVGFVFKISQKFDRFSYKVFGTPGVSLYALLMSILSGYPIGAKIISDLFKKGQITEKEAQKMSVFCTTSGPIFVIGTVGSLMFSNFLFGVILYLSHILSSIFLGIIFNLFDKTKSQKHSYQKIEVQKSKNLLSHCISETINSLFVVGAYITLFFLVSELFSQLKLFDILTSLFAPIFSKLGLDLKYLTGLLYGIVEVTRGAKTLSALAYPASLILTSGIISFSGISILMQSLAFLKEAKIKAHTFILSKCVHMIVSMIFCAGLLIII